jgi:hypothetical protein
MRHNRQLTLCCVFCILFLPELRAQGDSAARLRRMPAFGLDYISSGNSHGGFLRLFAGFEKRRNLLVAGPLLQLSGGKVNGARISYSRNISAAPHRSPRDDKGRHRYDRVQFNYGLFLQYIHNAALSERVRQSEERISRDSVRNFAAMRMNTLEAGASIELRINLSHNVTWYNSAALSMHHHLKYANGLSRARTAPSLGLSSGFLIVLY